jgi:hypothetical protein
MPTRVHPEGFGKVLELLFTAGALARAYARYDRGAVFAKALSAVLWAYQWSRRSAQLFVSAIARAAGDMHGAHLAMEGRLGKRPWVAAEHPFQGLSGAAQDPQWARVEAGLREDPRTIQQDWQLDQFGTMPFVDMVEDLEHHDRHHRRR